MEEILKMLDENLELIKTSITENNIVLNAKRTTKMEICPHCKSESSKVHSMYIKKIQDLPIQDKMITIILERRVFICDNKHCKKHKFSEELNFITRYQRRTTRLDNKINEIAVNTSALRASAIISSGISNVSDDTILRLLKKKKLK